MDVNILRGLLTLVLMCSFIGMVIWAYSSKRKSSFAEAASLPLRDEEPLEQRTTAGDKP